MIALAMIIKGVDEEAPLLDACLKSVRGHIDAIYLNLNFTPGKSVSPRVIEVAKKYNAVIYKTVWEDNFVKARTFIFDKVPKKYGWIIWLDADDTVENPEKIKDVAAVAGDAIKGLYIQYDYAHDEYGNCTVTHWVCRMCRNDGSYVWQSSIYDEKEAVHETLSPARTVGKARNNEFKIIHQSNGERRAASLERNTKLLEGMYKRQIERKKLDPRTMYYLATHYFDAGRYEEVQELLLHYLEVSGWAEERSEAWVYLGLCFERFERNDAARQAFGHALLENPKNPRPYVELGELEFLEKRYLMSEDWLLMAIGKREQETANVVQPMENKYRAYMLLAQTYINMGFMKLKEANKYVNMALKLRPTDPLAKRSQKLVEDLYKVKNRTQSIMRLAKMFEEAEEPEKIIDVLNTLPQDMQDNPAVIGLRQNFQKPIKWPKKSIAIVCAEGPLGIWGPWSLEEGIGGSEEAVIRLSKELAKQWEVTVFATPGSRAGEYDGVDWRQYWELNYDDEFDVLIGWRNPAFFENKFKARKKYLWLHDAINPKEFSEDRLKNIDKVILLSQYHRTLFPELPDNKIFISSNGITPEDFEIKSQPRNPHRIIYMSSHVRGLELLYGMWPEVKKAVPDATLDIYYGWESFVAIHNENLDRLEWMKHMKKLEKQLDGVTDHGKISQPQIVEEIFRSGIWAYPCPFPEISCITAMKAQAGGAIPVSSNFAALEETVQFGTKVPMKAQDPETPVGKWDKAETAKFRDALIDMLKDTNRQESIRRKMTDWSRENQTWKRVAEQWTKELKGE